jgi:ketopantoate hydroxymethyltransferase
VSIAEQAASLLDETGDYASVHVLSSRSIVVVAHDGHPTPVNVRRDPGFWNRGQNHKACGTVYVTHDGQALYRYGI